MIRKRILKSIAVLLVAMLLPGCDTSVEEPVPDAWKHLVRTDGQAYPVPEAWLSTPEGKFAHNLKLPDTVPKPVPFDFEAAGRHRFWEAQPNVPLKYFEHLCRTEAGEWIFRKVENVEGLYFARPEDQPSDDYLGDLYGPEAPWIERNFQLMGEDADWRGGVFVRPPFHNFLFFEEPRREVKWQRDIGEPYIRIFGYTYEKILNPAYYGKKGLNDLWFFLKKKTPMQVVGIPEPTARYGYTWRGITRSRDRENRIAGGELIVYDRVTGEVIAVSRDFQITSKNLQRAFGATWMVSPTCQNRKNIGGSIFYDFVKRVLTPAPNKDPDLSWVKQ